MVKCEEKNTSWDEVELSGNLFLCTGSSERSAVLEKMWITYMEVPCEAILAQASGLNFERFRDSFSSSDVVGILVNGNLAGGAIFKAGNMHLAVGHVFKARWFKSLKPLLSWAFGRYGSPMKARINKDNGAARKFVEQVGCKLVKIDEHSAHYSIVREEMFYGRSR